jgi:ribonuclease HI
MWVTAYTDASFNGHGGWAVWLRSERGRVVRSGKCPDTIKDSMCAEMYAIIMAIELALAEWKDTKGIQLNTDCKSLVDRLYPWSKPFLRDDLECLRLHAREITDAAGIRLRVKHVKGHSHGDGTRTYLNHQVDKISRKHTR